MWNDLRGTIGMGLVQKKISTTRKAFYFGFYSELFSITSKDTYSAQELDFFLTPVLPAARFRLRLDRIKELKENFKNETIFREELLSFFADGQKRFGADNYHYLTIGKALSNLYVYTLTKQITPGYTKHLDESLRFLLQNNDFNEGSISKKELLSLFNDQTCIKTGENCEEIKNRIYMILSL